MTTRSDPTDALPVAAFKAAPEDFVVDEVPAYEPSGQGDHLFVTFRKTGLTTDDAVRRLARALGVDARDAGVAGMKDKVAVTTQTVSFLVPKATQADVASLQAALVAAGSDERELTVLASARHNNKIKPGHLTANRFRIRLTKLASADDRARIVRGLERVAEVGVPNFYGAQRFGTDQANAERALAFIRGETRPPRDKRQVRFLFSAFQSSLFNKTLERRIEEGTWADVLGGDLAKKHDTGGLFLVPLEGPDLDDARARAKSGSISATGPMFGASMRQPEGHPAEIEAAVLREANIDADTLARFKHAGEGTRRALRLDVADLRWSESGDDLVVEFALSKGGYATTVLSAVCRLDEGRGGGARHGRSDDPSDTAAANAATPEACADEDERQSGLDIST
ncbi:MAG: tRNA pseudouridine(13) synthase TruD [Polyangiaceae bacterium]|nr:tRNA pseudouridine(13) synthase TruD [Polyangiaceae bacterium]